MAHANDDPPTLVAIGAAAGFALMTVHEVLGHSLLTVALGAHLVHITSVDSSYAGPASPTVMRAIAAAGITANGIAGVLALLARRIVSRDRPALQLFLWVFGHATLFMGSSYLAGFAFLPFGDVHAAFAGLEPHFTIQFLALVAGIAIYLATLRGAQRSFVSLAGTSPVGFRRALLPYIGMGAAVTLTAALNPAGPIDGIVWGAAATFGAGYGLVGAAARRDPSRTETLPISRSIRWLSAGAIAVVMLATTLGPGIPR